MRVNQNGLVHGRRSLEFFGLFLVALGAALAQDSVRGQDAAIAQPAKSLLINAKTDGSTDSTAAIQQSLDQAAGAGGQVSLPPGRYLVQGSLKFPRG